MLFFWTIVRYTQFDTFPQKHHPICYTLHAFCHGTMWFCWAVFCFGGLCCCCVVWCVCHFPFTHRSEIVNFGLGFPDGPIRGGAAGAPMGEGGPSWYDVVLLGGLLFCGLWFGVVWSGVVRCSVVCYKWLKDPGVS